MYIITICYSLDGYYNYESRVFKTISEVISFVLDILSKGAVTIDRLYFHKTNS